MSVVDELLAKVTSPQKEALEHVRQVVKNTVPTAEEVMTYGMPGFKYKKKYLIAFAAFKDHMSIFPGAEAPMVLEKEAAPFKTSKGTLQFTIENPIPDELISKLLLVRVRSIDGA